MRENLWKRVAERGLVDHSEPSSNLQFARSASPTSREGSKPRGGEEPRPWSQKYQRRERSLVKRPDTEKASPALVAPGPVAARSPDPRGCRSESPGATDLRRSRAATARCRSPGSKGSLLLGLRKQDRRVQQWQHTHPIFWVAEFTVVYATPGETDGRGWLPLCQQRRHHVFLIPFRGLLLEES